MYCDQLEEDILSISMMSGGGNYYRFSCNKKFFRTYDGYSFNDKYCRFCPERCFYNY